VFSRTNAADLYLVLVDVFFEFLQVAFEVDHAFKDGLVEVRQIVLSQVLGCPVQRVDVSQFAVGTD
jgi:hypothetical protein